MIELTGDFAPRFVNEGDNLTVAIWWTQSWGCPALHYEERIPPVLGCNLDWYAVFPEDAK